MLASDCRKASGVLESKRSMQRDRGRLSSTDNCDHLTEAGLFCRPEQFAKQHPAKAFAAHFVVHINRIFAAEPVGCAVAELTGIGITDNCSVGFGDQPRPAAIQHLGHSPRHFRLAGRIDFVTRGSVQNVVTVDARDRGQVRRMRRAYFHNTIVTQLRQYAKDRVLLSKIRLQG